MIKAFLSHSSRDKEIVREIKRKISRIWTYFDEDCFEPGEDFRSAIKSRIENTNLFVLFASDASINSDWVRYEMDEAFWETIKNKNISVLVLNIGNLGTNDFPKWMLKAKIEAVDNISIAAQIILDKLSEFITVDSIFVGRDKETSKFYKSIHSNYDNFPSVIALSGLEGIGRRTFAKKIVLERLNFKYSLEFRIKEYEGIDELYRYLINDTVINYTKEEYENEIMAFNSSSKEEKYKEIARILVDYNNKKVIPIIVDDGGILDNNGYYKEDFYNVIKHFVDDYKDCYSIIIHKRIPQLLPKDYNMVNILKISELSSSEIFAALDILLKRNNIDSIDKSKVDELAEHLDGYPPAIYYAVNECVLYGIDAVCGDKSKLTDFKSGLFTGYLSSIPIDDFDSKVLKIVYIFELIDIETICILLKCSHDLASKTIIKLIEFNVIETTNSSYYTISSPIKVAVGRKVSLYNKSEMAVFSRLLMNDFNTNIKTSLVYIDNIITALLYSDRDEELQEFKTFLLPSKLMELACKYNIERDWKTSEKYIRQALKLEPNNIEAKIMLFKLLVRKDNRKHDNHDEENEILEELNELFDKRRYYLKGFRYWKRNCFEDAIEQFELGKKAGDNSIQIHRDLAECYFQNNNIEKAKQEISLVMIPGRKINNAFILDIAAKIAIHSNEFEHARNLITQLELVDREENVNHRKAILAIKEKKYDEALQYSEKSCSTDKVLPQMLLLHMNIAIHRNEYEKVEEDYLKYFNTFKSPSDMLEILYCTMLLNRDGWKNAEAAYSKISNKSTSISMNLRYKIIEKELSDNSLPIGKRKKLEDEIKSIDCSDTSDVLDVNQNYETKLDIIL